MNIGTPSPTDFISDHKPLGSSKIPPQPTRTIAPGDELHPAQRTHTPSSDEESSAEEGGDGPRMLLPDASRASCHPHTLRTPKMHVPAYAAQVVVPDTRVLVATHHHLRCFNVAQHVDVMRGWLRLSFGLGVYIRLRSPKSHIYRLAGVPHRRKQEFVKLLGGLLWTRVRSDTNGSGPTTVPIIRIYDVFTQGSIARILSVLPNTPHHIGTVTSGMLLQSHTGFAYLGHEGGFISIWNLASGPECTDVLSLEGVGMRLWAGGRTGVICPYDVLSRPWVVTNAWNAHSGLPVMRIFMDPWLIEKEEKLRVANEVLGWAIGDWLDCNELLKRESEFSSFRTINVLVVSWNVDATKPEVLTDDMANLTFLNDALTSVSPSPDIIFFGFQELVDLESCQTTNSSLYKGSIEYLNLADPPSHWSLAVSFIVQGKTTTIDPPSTLAGIDTGTTFIGAPHPSLQVFGPKCLTPQSLLEIGKAYMHSDKQNAHLFLACDTNVTVHISFGGTVDTNLGTLNDTMRIPRLRRVLAASLLLALVMLLLGLSVTLLKNVYSIFRASPAVVSFAQLARGLGSSIGSSNPNPVQVAGLTPLPTSTCCFTLFL
ncbi:hypothetical protein EDB19DRAFT_1973184 [Suillus lakei]|nr:hypothetical protein EDB19DRAFT_1973184 [Suillus lakei]